MLLAIWEVAGQFQLVASGALPAPSAILVRFWAELADYPLHVWSTIESAFLGFMIGNTVAVAAGVLFVVSPLALRACPVSS